MYDYDDWDEVDYKARDEIWTPEMVAERWRVSESHVRNLMLDGKLPAFKIGRLWRVYLSEIMKYEAQKIEKKPLVMKIQEMPTPKITRITG